MRSIARPSRASPTASRKSTEAAVNSNAPWLIAVMGPTASGKTELAESLADRLSARLINADAFQVYRGFDIGTGKSSRRAEYALIDVCDPEEPMGVGAWVTLALGELAALYHQRRSAVVVGGTGLYVRALMDEYEDLRPAPSPELRRRLAERERIEGIDSLRAELRALSPETAAAVDMRNPARVRRAIERLLSGIEPMPVVLPPFRKMKFILEPDLQPHKAAVEERVDRLLSSDWSQEVACLIAKGVSWNAPAMRAIGYRSLWRALTGELSPAECRAEIVRSTLAYAKRQRTWLRSERDAISIGGFGGDVVALEACLRHLML